MPRRSPDCEVLAEPVSFVSFTDQGETEIALTLCEEPSLKVNEKAHILLRSEPSHIPDAKRAVPAAAPLRRICFSIDAVCHQECGFACPLLQQMDHRFIGREQEAGLRHRSACTLAGSALRLSTQAHSRQASGRNAK